MQQLLACSFQSTIIDNRDTSIFLFHIAFILLEAKGRGRKGISIHIDHRGLSNKNEIYVHITHNSDSSLICIHFHFKHFPTVDAHIHMMMMMITVYKKEVSSHSQFITILLTLIQVSSSDRQIHCKQCRFCYISYFCSASNIYIYINSNNQIATKLF